MRTGLPDSSETSDYAFQLRKTAVIDLELARLNISIAALQETRLPDEGSLREQNYTFFWKGKDSNEHREHGVGFAVHNTLLNAIETPRGLTERIMVLRLNTKCGFVTLISAYAPTLTSTAESKDVFYDDLCNAVRNVPPGDRLYILGDFNARVGQDNATWPECLGYHGVGKQNENGQRLLEFCSKFQLCVTNTYFKGKIMRKVSWRHPRSGHWHQLDLVLTKRRDLGRVAHTRTFHGAQCDTDHSLVASKIRLSPKKIHSSKTPGRKTLNLPKTRDPELVESFSSTVRHQTATWDVNAPIEVEWESIKELLTKTAGKVFGYCKVKSSDWFFENLDQLQPLIDSKRQAALNYHFDPCDVTRAELCTAKSSLQRTCRQFANAYWMDLCRNIQDCADAGNFRGVYAGIRMAIGPVQKKTAPLKEIDGSIITDSSRLLERWAEHYTELYSQPAEISHVARELILTLPVMAELDSLPTIGDLHAAVLQLKCNKSPGVDGILTELLKLKCVLPLLHNFLGKCWEEGRFPRDMRDANIVTLYEGKGDRGDCNSYRGISLLSIVGKLFARVMLTKLQSLAERVYPEAQCGFRSERSTTDMIFTLRQLQEKCREQNTPLLIAFVDLNKAFDTVSREGLYIALEKIGCPPKLLRLVKSLHDDTKGTVIFDGQMSDAFDMRRGVRQGCVLAPTLFGIFFSLLLKVAFGDSQQGVHLHTRADGKLFGTAQLKSSRKREDLYIDSLLYADDAAFVAKTPGELQTLLDKFAYACSLFSMSINATKTVILAQGYTYQPSILLEGEPLKVVDKFCYLGSTVSNNLSIDGEIDIRIGKAATTFGRLRTRVWNNKHLTAKTKMIVYKTCILSILLYGAETWTSYAKQERRLNTFHMRCLRSILNITWKDRVTNERVLGIAQLPSVVALLKQKRLRWLGHVHRMSSARLPRQTLLGQIAFAKRNVGRPMLRFRDCAKRDMVAFNIDRNSWEDLASNRNEWRKTIFTGCKTHDSTWFEDLAQRRAKRHNREGAPPPMNPQYMCPKCGRMCRSRIGLFSHERRCRINNTDTD
ncbi:uncharacterized protein LOC123667510 [Melitaea cinxia]|uniref:uncharacterized protein LOC123667510 n=1 Tax=Melitaea cinxia TaxID=113334 RepID=UPI001E271279|nr:uncharacterized protein LOC123667510 [Melitaea cinxia]